MKLELKYMVTGPLPNNVFFLVDEESKDCVIVDPSFEPELQLQTIREQGWNLKQVWVTHPHYDHIWGVKTVVTQTDPKPLLMISKDAEEWANQQDSKFKMGMPMDELPPAGQYLAQGDRIDFAGEEGLVEIREVPGHCPGSLVYYVPSMAIAFVGDAVFRESIGRTDLPGSNHHLLLEKIRTQIFTLPDETILLPGHGESTTVAHEKENNPFLFSSENHRL